MKIKTQLRLGFGFLFLVVLAFGLLSLYYINRISTSARVILKDNYESLTFVRQMRHIVDTHALPLGIKQQEDFARQLEKEKHNITERGEAEAARQLSAAFGRLTDPAGTVSGRQLALSSIRTSLGTLDRLNMEGIVRKNNEAGEMARKARLYLAFAATIAFLILFTFIINFPSFVTAPLNQLIDGIRQISRKNYDQRLSFDTRDEFAEVARSFNVMAKRLKEWESSNVAKITSDKLRIEAIIEQMNDAIIGVNEKQEILFINNVAGELLNLDKEKSAGSDAYELMQKNDLLKNIVESEGKAPLFKIFANGKESYFQLDSHEINVHAYADAGDETLQVTSRPAGKVYTLKNITQFKELDEAKTNFIATVSHELKTPISSIKMSLKLLSDERVGTLNAEQRDLLENISEDSERLLKITSELLDLSQVETGNIQLSFAPVDPKQIARYAMDAVKLTAEQKEVRLELISRQNLPKVNADIEKTAWVLVNFLSNAIRYSAEKSKVLIHIQESGAYVQFSVRDTGKGIEEQYQKRLFERYFRVPADGKNASGTGLGLAISKDFIEAQHGEVYLRSELGAGSTFGFRLPKSNAQVNS